MPRPAGCDAVEGGVGPEVCVGKPPALGERHNSAVAPGSVETLQDDAGGNARGCLSCVKS